MERNNNMNKLSPNMKNLLLNVHSKHIKTMVPEKREKHTIDKVVKVLIDNNSKCLKVYYKHEWYHYTPAGTWY